MKKLLILLAIVPSLVFSEDKKVSHAEHLQAISVTIRSEGQWSNGEGSGVIFNDIVFSESFDIKRFPSCFLFPEYLLSTPL